MLTVGILGFGRLGQSIAKGLKKSKLFRLEASRRNSARARELAKQFKIRVYTNNHDLVRHSDILVLAVKPSQAELLLKEIKRSLKKKHLLVSVCASITNAQLRRWSGHKKIIRAMPNLPCLVNQGITVLSPLGVAKLEDLQTTVKLFESLGDVLVLDEAQLDAVTALSACGPAFMFTIIESFIEAGVKVGLSRDVSRQLVLRTFVGSGLMVEKTRMHPAALKDLVTTPAGCTIDGLQKLEEGRLRATMVSAVHASTKRASQLRQK